MIPLFKSDYSIGRSILKLKASSDEEESSDGIFDIVKEAGLKEVFLVEDSMIGFLNAAKLSESLGVQLIFGYRFTIHSDVEIPASRHKLIIFAKNGQGCKDLYKLYTAFNSVKDRVIDYPLLHANLTDNLLLVNPFYDSFLFYNSLYLGNCIPDFRGIKPLFFVENNDLPFDNLLRKTVEAYADKNDIVETKSIFYKHRSDAEALQTYKIICNRSFGKTKTLSAPNLNHFGSREFCWESFLDNAR